MRDQTAFAKMKEAKLQAPEFKFEGNYFVVRIGHSPLARPEELILEYLDTHSEITNKVARQITGIQSENLVKQRFYNLQKAGSVERVPGKSGSLSAWRRVIQPEPGDSGQQAFELVAQDPSTNVANGDEGTNVRQCWQPRRTPKRRRKGKR